MKREKKEGDRGGTRSLFSRSSSRGGRRGKKGGEHHKPFIGDENGKSAKPLLS